MFSTLELNPFSGRFVERLFAAHPEWRTLAQQDPRIEDLLGDRFVVVIRLFFGRPAWSRAVRVGRVRRPLVGRVEAYSWSGAQDATVGSG